MDTVDNAEYTEDEDVYVTFSINEEKTPLFAIPKKHVKYIFHIEEDMPFTKVPNAPDCVAGILCNEGLMLTVIDPYGIWGMPMPEELKTKLLCFQSGGNMMGLYADEIENIQVPEDKVQSCGLIKNKAFAHAGRIYTLMDLSQFGIEFE